MNTDKLRICPDWPAVMDVGTASLYLGGKEKLLQSLRDRGYLAPLIEGAVRTCFRREDIDTALSCAQSHDDDLR